MSLMSFIACGINHQTAPLSIREKVVVLPEHTPHTLHALLQYGAAKEAMILSTCNRTEIYTHTHTFPKLVSWLNEHPQISPIVNTHHWYWHHDQQAINHLMRVASGLDSMILGEPQILGQMKQAFAMAQTAGTVGNKLCKLIQKVFSVTKQVRTQTDIGAHPVSVPYMAVNLAKRIFSDVAKTKVLLVGAGQTIELAAQHLYSVGVRQFVFSNRSLEKASELADRFQGISISLLDIPEYLRIANIVITATGSPVPLIDKYQVETALKSGKRRPILMLDLAVPRDIDASVSELEDVYLYNMDHLQQTVDENRQLRLMAADQAESLIAEHSQAYLKEIKIQEAGYIIQAYREKLEALQAHALKKAVGELERGKAPEEVLKQMAHTLTNKMLHAPSVALRQAVVEGEMDRVEMIKKVFEDV